MADQETSELARAIQDITERAQLLVREEVELAKAEMTYKVTKLIKGAIFGIIAGIFARVRADLPRRGAGLGDQRPPRRLDRDLGRLPHHRRADPARSA